jgi:hypothetical protein
MRRRASINWGRWLREYKQDKRVVKEIQKVSRSSKLLAATAIIITILIASTAILINYFAGVRSSEKIEKSTMMMLDENKQSIQQTLNAINPNDFIFRLFENGQSYTPASINDYVRLHIVRVRKKKIPLDFQIKNNARYPARNVYCQILFSNQEFAESGNDIVRRLSGLGGLNTFHVDSSNDYLNESAAFEWASIPPNTSKALPGAVYLTMTGKTGRLTVIINSVSRIVFEFRLEDPKPS